MSAALDLPDLPQYLAERPRDAQVVEALIAGAFGPGRFAKTAERLREGARLCLDLNVVAWSGTVAVGCVRQWPVTIGPTPALLLGPIAVDDAWRHHGVGSGLVRRACDAAQRAGHALIVLVGDEPFFGPHGFSAAAARAVRLPGPVNPRRVMVKELVPGAAAGLAGLVRPIRA
jgi:predicted N-acetyltransferase YhbS